MSGERCVIPDYIEAGKGKPLIFIPGMEGAKEFWEPQMRGLEDAYHTIATSLPVWKPCLASAVSHCAGSIIALMDALGLEKAVVVGESFGGMVIQELALSYPQRLSGIILCNTMDRPRRGGFGMNVFTLATLVHQCAFLPFLTMDQRCGLMRWVGRHRGFVLDPSPRNADLVEYIIRYGTACGPAAYLDRMIAGAKASYTTRLREISVPALVLRGEEDRLIGAETVMQLAGRIPHADLVIIAGGGHCCTYTVPEASNLAIREWLRSIGYYGAPPSRQDANPYIGIT
ncbi:MAG: alpha/beta hydrolase [Actinobacteria bacterium]|jgi:pimeloyl-ACP methyl ester carboxylesterase|nr:MAG: alpha/beta hydrolase [Actinomycetota bacterium]